jgi:hypothetical protein
LTDITARIRFQKIAGLPIHLDARLACLFAAGHALVHTQVIDELAKPIICADQKFL